MTQQNAQSELLTSEQAAERNFSTQNIVGGGCVDCGCEVLVFYHYDGGKGIPDAPFEMTDSKKNVYTGKTDKNGLFKAENIACGQFEILFDEGSDEFTPVETVANNPVLQANPEYAALATEYFMLYEQLHQKGYATADADDWYGDDDVEHDIADISDAANAQDKRAIQRFRELAERIENDNGPLEKAIVKSHHQLAGEASDNSAIIMAAAEVILGCVPVVGDVIDVKDCAIWLYDGVMQENGADFGDPFYLAEGALNMIGFVPILGNAIKKSCKPIIKFMRKTDDMATAVRKIRKLSDGNLIKFLKSITGKLKKYADEAVKIAKQIAQGLASLVTKMSKWLLDSLLAILRKVADYAKKLVDWIKEAVANLKKWIDEFIGKIFNKRTGTPHKKGEIKQTEMNAGADTDVSTHQGSRKGEDGKPATESKGGAGTCPVSNPINPVTGQVLEQHADITLPTSPPLRLSRRYGHDHEAGGILGAHWHTNLDVYLRVTEDGYWYTDEDLAEIHYYDPDPGQQNRNLDHPGERLCRTEQGALYLLNPDGERYYFGYALGCRLVLSAMEDANGNRIDIQRRPSDGFPVALRHSDGQTLLFSGERTEDELDLRLTRTRHTAQGITTDLLNYQYDDQQHLNQIEGQLTHPGARYQYTDTGRIRYREDNTGQAWTEYIYDAENRVTAVRSAGDHYNGRFDYQPGITRYHTPAGGQIDYQYDTRERITRIETCLGAVYHNAWQNHLLTARTDPLGRETAYAYDDWGHVTQITHPDGRVEQIERDAQGRATTYTDPAGAAWQYQYDERGNLNQLINPLDQALHYQHDAQGRLLDIAYPGGGHSQYAYDPTGQLRQLTSPDGHQHQYQHDPLGRLSEYQDPAGHKQRWLYPDHSHLPQPERHLSPNGHTRRQQYDAQGRVIQRTDANGHTTHTTWGPYDTLQSLTDPQGRKYQFEYGPNAELVQVTNPVGETYRYVRDRAGRVTEEHDYAGAITRYEYDLVGRLIRTQKPDGARITYAYDDGDRLIEKTVHSATSEAKPQTTHYAYDDAGRLIEARNAHSQIELERDALGRVTAEKHNGRTLKTAYNADGYRENLQGEGIHQTWRYGPEQQVQQLRLGEHDPLAFQYDPRGFERYRHTEQGFGLTQQYDPEGLLAQQQAGPRIFDMPDLPPHASLVDRRYDYDPGGRLTSQYEAFWGNTHYRYDRSDRVTRAEREFEGLQNHQRLEEYSYNAHGDLHNAARSERSSNVIDLAQYQQARRYRKGGKLQHAGNTHYTYDLNGRLIEKREHKKGFRPQTWQYQWDDEDQLIMVENPDGEIWRYAYDPFGRRSQKTRTQNSKRHRPPPPGFERPIRQGSAYQWDGDRLIQEAPIYADGTVAWDQAETWHYEADSFRPIAKEHQGQLYYVVTDHLGTPRELMDEQGKPVWRARFSVWGDIINKNAQNDPDYEHNCNLRFQGQQYDPESGLHYNRHRYYDPDSAQYLSPDPIGLAGGLTPQAYVHDPNGWVDPLGLDEIPCPKSVDDLIKDSKPGKETKGRTKQFERSGGLDQANKDFDDLQPQNIKEIDTPFGSGRTGTLSDGSQINVRPGSSNSGPPTLEIQKRKNRTKFRYSE